MKLFLFIIFLCGAAAPGIANASARWSVNLHLGSGNHYHDHYDYNRWHNGYYGYRSGWWIGDNDWEYYPTPAPAPVLPPPVYIVERPAPAAPPVISPIQPPYYSLPPSSPPISVTPVIPHRPTEDDPTIYYCAYSNSYYPTVRSCPGGWEIQYGKRVE